MGWTLERQDVHADVWVCEAMGFRFSSLRLPDWNGNGLGLGLMIVRVEENLQIVCRRLIEWNGMEWMFRICSKFCVFEMKICLESIFFFFPVSTV